jgi:hypothetical protein
MFFLVVELRMHDWQHRVWAWRLCGKYPVPDCLLLDDDHSSSLGNQYLQAAQPAAGARTDG